LRNESDVSAKSIQTDCADIIAIDLNFTAHQLHSTEWNKDKKQRQRCSQKQ
jgi:hypothetical protein